MLISDDQILLTNESYNELNYTKFPGGGLEFGEGLVDCLIREIKEELHIDIDDISHFYTTDFYQESIFNSSQQLISVYYKVKLPKNTIIHELKRESKLNKPYEIKFKWVKLSFLSAEMLTFPIDKIVVKKLQESI